MVQTGQEKMEDNRKYLAEIVENIRQVNPHKIILFGSSVKGVLREDSDLDLVVILDSHEITQSYDDRIKNKLLVRRAVYELSKKVPVDLVVYTKGEYDIISKSGGLFYNQIETTGKVLYEKAV
jgi:predicted nucleotidyltransferase